MASRDLRIVQAGLGKKAASLVEVGMSPKDIAATLNAEDVEKLHEHEMLDLTVRDVLEYKEFLETLEASEVSLLVKGNADEKRVAARVRERLEKTLDLMETVESVAHDVVTDFRHGRDQWQKGEPHVIEGAHGGTKLIYPPYPSKQLKLLLDVVGEGRSLVQTLHQDQGIQSFIKHATVNVNQAGMSQKDIYQILRYMAKELNIPMDKMMEVFGDAQEALTTRRGPIDV